MHQLPHEPQLEHKLRTLEKSIFLEKTRYLTKQPKKQLAPSPPPLSKKSKTKKEILCQIHLSYQILNFKRAFMSESKYRTNLYLTSAFTMHPTNTNSQIDYTV